MVSKIIIISLFSLSNLFAQCIDETWVSDGYCDSGNNNAECNWDGGDCCSSTCVPSTYDCDLTGQAYGPCATNNCLDPNGNNDDCLGGGDTGGGTTGGGTTGGGDCEDFGDGLGGVWYDSDGPQFNCAWYATGTNCASYGDAYENFGYTANEACCVCGGGTTGGGTGGGTGGDPDGPPTNLSVVGDYGSISLEWSAPTTGGGTGGTGGGVSATCAGFCGGQGSDATCWCDDLCEQYGDCCADYYDECSDGNTGGTTGGGITGGDTGGDACAASGGNSTWIGDGWCDDGLTSPSNNNNAECQWDGGDCCCMTCVDNVYACQTNGPTQGSCLDPSVDQTEEADCLLATSCEAQGLVTCWDGSCAVSESECPQEPFAGQDCCELNDCSTDPTFVGTVLDCTLQYCFPNIELGDGTCTDYTAAGYDGVGFNCEELNFDNGDCQGQLFSVIDNKPKYIINKNSIGKDMLNISNMTQKYGNDYFDAISEKQKHFEYMYMYNQKIRSNRTTDRNLLGYNIFRDGTLIADSLSLGNTNFVDYEVSDNTEYCYQVSAIYEDTESLSDVSCASTLGAPDAMVNFSGSAASGTLDVLMTSSVDVAGFQFVVSGGTVTGASGGLAEENGFQVSSSEDGIVLGFSFDGSTIPASEGNLVTITFDYEGVVDICMETAVLSDSNGNPISVAVGGCESTEISVVLGDVNGDLSINVLDILVIVNAIVGSEILTPFQFEAADMNFDGSANVVDIIAIVNIILGNTSAMNQSINEGVVTLSSNNINIKSDVPIAGFELDLDGNFILNDHNFPDGWKYYYNQEKILAFTLDGKELRNEISIQFNGSMKVELAVIVDMNNEFVNAIVNKIPSSYSVSTAYPNPFNPVTNFDYSIPEDVSVNISVFDAAGSRIAELFQGNQVAGLYSITWDAQNYPSGIYFLKFTAGSFVSSEKVILLK